MNKCIYYIYQDQRMEVIVSFGVLVYHAYKFILKVIDLYINAQFEFS